MAGVPLCQVELRPVSMTEILDWIDPSALPERVRASLGLLGPWLALGLTYREIGERVGYSEDYVANHVRAIRFALVAEALTRADDMSEALRERLEKLHREHAAAI